MSGIPSAAEIEAAKAALQANVGGEAKQQAGSSVSDVAGNVAAEGVVESIGSIATTAGEVVVSVIGGIFEG